MKILPKIHTAMILTILAQHPGLTCTCYRKCTLFASTVLAAVITVKAKYFIFVRIHRGGQGRPGLGLMHSMRYIHGHAHLHSCGKVAGPGPCPLCLIILGTEGVNRGQSSYYMESAASRLYFLIELAYISVILHIIWI